MFSPRSTPLLFINAFARNVTANLNHFETSLLGGFYTQVLLYMLKH